MFNFLNSNLNPKVICKYPATDNYEVENLISQSYTDRNRGFIAYSAIKPPIEIEFEFICPVNIHYINLNTTVGSQKCSGIEIFAKNAKFPYTSICSCVYDESGITFCNSRMFSKTNKPEYFNDKFHLAFFKSNTFRCFLDASFIKIVIFRTQKSVPCLGSVEVWGAPSKTCSQTTVQTINRIMNKISHPSSSISFKDEEFKIPEDFKDDLTYEIMSVPMTLPSGKTVDQSTLDKHVKSEISYGRKPCDPFTGIKFTDKLKPILNVALKSRIDMFILQNSDRQEFGNITRTLGRAGTSKLDEKVPDNKRKRSYQTCNLDEAIARAKRSPNFTCFTSKMDNGKSCAKCQNKCDFLYEIPCRHLHCRICLLKICEDFKCSVCDSGFINSDVKKCNM